MFAVAFLYSNLGLGGGLLFVPILLFTGVADHTIAVPISLSLTIMTATSSVLNHRRKGFVDFRLARTLVVGTLLGTVLGTTVSIYVLNALTFELFFVAVILVFGTILLRDWLRNARPVDSNDDARLSRERIAGATAAVTGSGLVSGALGVGGGLLNVPILVYLLGRKTRTAIGTSSLLIVPTAAFGFVLYVVELWTRSGGLVLPEEFLLIPILMPVVFAGAYIGSRWGLERLKTRSVALLFILVLFVAAVKLVYDLVP